MECSLHINGSLEELQGVLQVLEGFKEANENSATATIDNNGPTDLNVRHKNFLMDKFWGDLSDGYTSVAMCIQDHAEGVAGTVVKNRFGYSGQALGGVLSGPARYIKRSEFRDLSLPITSFYDATKGEEAYRLDPEWQDFLDRKYNNKV